MASEYEPIHGRSPTFVILVVLALIAHQIFRTYEPYSLIAHATLLLIPPFVIHAVVERLEVASPSVWWCYGSYLSMLGLCVICYRLSPLHPLARYSGPVRYKISKFVWACENLSGYSHYRLKAMHERLGEVVRIGPNELSICDPAAIRPTHGTPGVPKSPYVIGASLDATGSDVHMPLIGVMELGTHQSQRRAWNRALSTVAVKEHAQIMVAWARVLVERLAEQQGEVSLDMWLNYFTHDFVCEMTFGVDAGLLRNGDPDDHMAKIAHGVLFSTFFGHVPWLGILVARLPGLGSLLHALMTFAYKRTDERLRRGSKSRDIFYYITNEDLPDKPSPPLQQLRNDGIHAIIAGADTTSSALTSVFFCLATYPDAYACLKAEVDEFYFAGVDALDGDNHHAMPYLNAVINESMRMFPPSPSGGSRWVPPHGTAVHAGTAVIPPGTTFWIPFYSLYRDSRNFSFPDTFWPERWLVASGHLSLESAIQCLPKGEYASTTPSTLKGLGVHASLDFKHNESAFNPFSYGPMNCPGRSLALLTLRTVVSTLVQKFDVKLREGWDPREYAEGYKDYVLASRPELPVLLEARHYQ